MKVRISRPGGRYRPARVVLDGPFVVSSIPLRQILADRNRDGGGFFRLGQPNELAQPPQARRCLSDMASMAVAERAKTILIAELRS